MRTALVTGATRGIGRGIALELARQHFGLMVSARREDDLLRLAEELRAAGAAEVHVHPADLADRDAAAAAVDVHRSAFADMSTLVLAGGVGTAGPIESLSRSRIDKTFAVNVASAIAILQFALPLLRGGAAADPVHGARVIALASITGAFAERGLAVYGASKAALISLIETLNSEESGNGVMGTAIAPAYVSTDMSAWVTDTIPADSMIQVDDVVGVVRMLLDLGATASITKIVMSRSGTDGYRA